MPSSTIWRKTGDGSVPRGQSPVRPSSIAIERISPEPFNDPSPQDNTRHHRTTYLPSPTLRGLGLSEAGLLDGTSYTAHPSHLYIDQNGGAHVSARVVNAGPPHDNYRTQEWLSRTSKLSQEIKRSRGKGHTRSGSTIDDLASAAIATGSILDESGLGYYTFTGSPNGHPLNRPSTSYITRYDYQENIYEPPPKRIKSEKLPPVEWSPLTDRSNSAFQHSTEMLNEEAALLLGLRTEVNFKTHVSPAAPAAVRLHHSPTLNHISPIIPTTPPAPMLEEVHDLNDGYSPITQVEQLEQSEQHREDISESQPIPTEVKFFEHHLSDVETSDNANNPQNTSIAEKLPLSRPSSGKRAEGVIQPRKVRRVKPQVQAEVCTRCKRLQRETDGDDDTTISWICCNGCECWFHAVCVGFKSKADARSVDKFVCENCEPKHGKTTFVRKSSRARTAIDYAGLNQGLVKSSVDTSMHHYVQPIKDGKISFVPDDFARIKPELLTAEFLEKWDGMKRPFVVPACWNPRFGSARPVERSSIDDSDTNNKRYDGNGVELGPDTKDPTDDESETVVDCDQDLLDMVMPRDLTVRKVAELYGADEPVPVIDVKSQETKGTYTLSQWADYYELAGEKPIRNVISLEVSESRLGRLIRRPRVVRELDLEDHVWDEELRAANKKRPVQFYCLMSVADSYTDFHIDFGGSSVYYHILKGRKTFFFIPPEDRYLKKYEEWCNSDTQNDTFLGDLCNNNCTRVDLYEGDTAFIPAGWIHAVWTPEDSLVIGGNFLTRLDYEMQLKVVNVEKVTKVSPKFRYPFFQKVMWYALIKYLEDDPVPEEVLQDFQDDTGYVYLRGNEVWHEIDELSNDAEPSTSEFNARHYPKAEISGLPALRDFLYRTARIYADLPVPDINKKQIDAVKASVPKGHGDPLMLIKLFAVWCAWKIGGVPVPDWVHSDAGGLPEFEKKERMKRSEPTRLPGERTSLRKANQASPQEVLEVATVTPNKPMSVGPEVDSDSGKTSKSGSKSSGLRIACDSCRKRRIKCRHKEDDLSPNVVDSVPSFWNHTAHSADGTPVIAPFLSQVDGNKLPSPETHLHESNLNSNLAQAALATLDSHFSEPPQLMTNGNIPSSGKKSRSKACEECRKSKRRCVHDEHGRVDPAKAAEPSKPRGSANSKRSSRPSDESLPTKRSKTEVENESILTAHQYMDFDALIDPALMHNELCQNSSNIARMDSFATEVADGIHNDLEEPHNDDGNNLDPETRIPSIMDRGAVLDPALFTTSTAIVDISESTNEFEQQDIVDTIGVVEQDETSNGEVIREPTSVSTINANDNAVLTNGVSPTSRQSSRQPKQVERYTPENHRSPIKQSSRIARGERRASSAISGQTIFTNAKSRRSSSNTSGTTHQAGNVLKKRPQSREVSVRPGSRGSEAESDDLDADEKFARELQAAENGLRRRASVRA